MSLFSFFSRKKKQDSKAAEQRNEQELKQIEGQEAPAAAAPAEAVPSAAEHDAAAAQAAEKAEVKTECTAEESAADSKADVASAAEQDKEAEPAEAPAEQKESTASAADEVSAEAEDSAAAGSKAEAEAESAAKAKPELQAESELKGEPQVEEVKHPAAEVKIVTVPEPKAEQAAKLKAESEVKAEEPEAEPVKEEPIKEAAPAPQAEDAAKAKKASRKSKRAAKKAAKAQESAAQAAETASALAAEAAVEAKDESKAAEAPAPAAEIQAAEPAVQVEAKQAAQAAEAAAVPQTEAAVADAAENAEQPEDETAQGEKAEEAADEAESQGEAKSEAKAEVRETFFSRLKKTRENLALGVSAFFKGRVIDEELYEDLETSLLTADLGVETTEFVIEKLREEAKLRELHDASLLKKRLQQILVDLLKPCEQELVVTDKKPFVILMVGVNGAGKTTTIGKLARKYKDQGLKVMLAAGDTFRAAAVEQLKEWGKRADVPVISQPTGSDSASVLFDALNAAKARNMDVLICDTAGRLQNKSQLMEELKKIVRVMKKLDPEVPHEVLLVLDAATGQNAVSQTKIFKEAVDVSGICLTKLDGTAKGGVIFALADKFKLPLRFVGLGEKAEDLRPFEAEVFVDALLRGE